MEFNSKVKEVKKVSLFVCVFAAVGLVNCAAALQMQVDIALPYWDGSENHYDWEGVPIPGTLKDGWIPWCAGRWGDMYGHGTTAVEDTGGTGISMMLSTVYRGLTAVKACGMCMPSLNGGTPYGSPIYDPICNTWMQVADKPANPGGDIVLGLYNLPPGEYELYSYHNNFECHRLDQGPDGTPACCDLIANPQPLMPSITVVSLSGLLEFYSPYDGWGQWQDVKREFSDCRPEAQWDHPVCENLGDGVEMIEGTYNVQVQQVTSDDELVRSRVRFRTNGSAVHIIYESGCCTSDGVRPKRTGGRAILNAFELISNTGTEAAALPGPADGEQELAIDTALNWVAGGWARWHDVYIGTDESAVRDATDPNTPPGRGRVAKAQLAFGMLGLQTTYYWRVDEVNGAEADSPWRGEVWSFTTAGCVEKENFESYDDSEALQAAVLAVSGGWVELSTVEYAEGEKSMQMDYYNKSNFKYSEAQIAFDEAQNWTLGFERLELSFRGTAGNGADRIYAVLDDAWGGRAAVVHPGDFEDLRAEQWQRWIVDLEEFSAEPGSQQLDLKAVTKLAVGVGDRNSQRPSGSAGTIYFDDIAVCGSGGGSGCRCPGDVNPGSGGDGQIDLDDLQAVAAILLDAGSPFVVPVEAGHCGDLDANGQVDLDDLQAVAGILLDAGSPFIVSCE